MERARRLWPPRRQGMGCSGGRALPARRVRGRWTSVSRRSRRGWPGTTRSTSATRARKTDTATPMRKPRRARAKTDSGRTRAAAPPWDWRRGLVNGPIKKSRRDICHAAGQPRLPSVTRFRSYPTVEACLASGGRLPKPSGADWPDPRRSRRLPDHPRQQLPRELRRNDSRDPVGSRRGFSSTTSPPATAGARDAADHVEHLPHGETAGLGMRDAGAYAGSRPSRSIET